MHSHRMTRHIYLVRHGLPHFPGEGSWCLGTADFGLSTLGRLQACQLGEALKGKELNVFSSPLGRAYGTAQFLSDKPIVLDQLREMHTGDWDGLCFEEIKKRWPVRVWIWCRCCRYNWIRPPERWAKTFST